jgi:hypothetical protein
MLSSADVISRHSTFSDADGDLATVRVTRGVLVPNDFVFDSSSGPPTLAQIDLTRGGVTSGSDFTLTVRRIGGDGRVDIGHINATGLDLGRVSVAGSLKSIDVGSDLTGATAIELLQAHSMIGGTPKNAVSTVKGRLGLLELAGDLSGVTLKVLGDIGHIAAPWEGPHLAGGIHVQGSIENSRIMTNGDIAQLQVGGNLSGTILSSRGDFDPASAIEAKTFGSIRVGGDVNRTVILAGYDLDGSPLVGDVSIKSIRVGGDWIASTVAVGVGPGPNGNLGDADDLLIRGEVPEISADIASVVVRGRVLGSEHGGASYGFFAEQIRSMTVTQKRLRLSPDGDAIVLAAGVSVRDGLRAGTTGRFPAELNLSELNGHKGFTILGEGEYDSAGASIRSAGDVNGDGIGDILISATHFSQNENSRSSVYVLFGQKGDFPGTFDLAELNGRNGFKVTGISHDYFARVAVSGAGDVNGDGFDDVIIGNRPRLGIENGAAYVIFGGDERFAPRLNVTKLDGTNGFTLEGSGGMAAGGSVSSAGDVNGDGYGDILVAAPSFGTGLDRPGAAFLIFGKADPFSPKLQLSEIDGVNGFRILGESNRDNAGFTVAGIGDFNGHGFVDVAVGARDSTSHGLYTGATYIIFGKADTLPTQLELSSLDGTTGLRLLGSGPNDYVARVSGAGDVNGDGLNDVIIGARGYLREETEAGAYIVFGRRETGSSTIELSALNGSDGFALRGEHPGEWIGESVSGAGGINGDGFSEVIIGAARKDRHGYGAGESFVIFGKPLFDASITFGSSAGGQEITLNGANKREYSGAAVSGAVDFNGDGLDDLLIGAAGLRKGPVFTGGVYVVYGVPTAAPAAVPDQ